MGRFLVGLMIGGLIGYWYGVENPDAYKKYIPYRNHEKVQHYDARNGTCLDEFLKYKSRKACELEKKLK